MEGRGRFERRGFGEEGCARLPCGGHGARVQQAAKVVDRDERERVAAAEAGAAQVERLAVAFLCLTEAVNEGEV